MIEIVLYNTHYQKGVEAMVSQIDLEFTESIFAPAQSLSSKNQPPLPDAYWVALSGDEVVGTIAVTLGENQTCTLKKMMLKKAYRGKELGISTRLLHTALDWSKSQQIQKMYLGTMSQFTAAQRFYEKNGFEQIAKEQLPNGFINNPVDSVFYWRDLSLSTSQLST